MDGVVLLGGLLQPVHRLLQFGAGRGELGFERRETAAFGIGGSAPGQRGRGGGHLVWIWMLQEADQKPVHAGGWEHEIHRAGRDRAVWHVRLAGLGRVLRDDDAARRPGFEHADGAVRAGAGEDDAGGTRAGREFQRMQQKIERQPRAVARQRHRQAETALRDGQE